MATELSSTIDVAALATKISQREWLAICRALDANKDDVLDRSELLMPAVAWVYLTKRDGTPADWDTVLDLTDLEVVELLGLAIKADDPKDTSPSEDMPNVSGDSTEPASASPPA